MMFGRKAKNEEEKKLIAACYKAGMGNGWASGRFAMADGDFITEDDRLNLSSIFFIDSLKELKSFFKYGNWCLGQGVIYKTLFFLQQIDGGDEWATYKIADNGEIFQFESVTFQLVIKDGEFERDIKRMLKASDEQLKKLDY